MHRNRQKDYQNKKVELKNYTVNDGTKTQLKPKFTPSNATLKNCKWTVSDSKIASIDSKGNLTAKKPGKVTVTCKTLDTGKSAKCTVTVKAVKVKSIKFSAAAKSIVNGKSLTFKPEFNPKNTTDKSLTWKSSNSKVATVDKNGVVRAVGVGKAKITCTTKLGKKSASYTVTVTPAKVTSVKLNKTSMTLDYSRSYTLKATVAPSCAANKKLTWKSSNTKVATVSSKGVVKAVGKGTATITCTSQDGSKKTANAPSRLSRPTL